MAVRIVLGTSRANSAKSRRYATGIQRSLLPSEHECGSQCAGDDCAWHALLACPKGPDDEPTSACASGTHGCLTAIKRAGQSRERGEPERCPLSNWKRPVLEDSPNHSEATGGTPPVRQNSALNSRRCTRAGLEKSETSPYRLSSRRATKPWGCYARARRHREAFFDESVVEQPIADESQANAVLAKYSSLQQASDRLFDLLVTIENTGSTVGLIRDLANHFYMADVIDGSGRHIAEVLSNLAAYIPGVAQPDGSKIEPRPLRSGEAASQHVPAYVRSLECKDAWIEALLIARASSVLGRFPFSNARTKAVAMAAARMKQRGYVFTIDRGVVRMPHPEIEKIVAEIENSLRRLGCADALSNLTRAALNAYRYAYEQILFGQNYTSGLGERPPTIPVGLLFNIAVKLPLWADGIADRPAAWNNHPRKKQVEKFNENLEAFQEETRRLLAAGHDRRAHALNAASTSIAQLDIILQGAQSLDDVRGRLALPINFSTFNVLLEHFNLERMRSSSHPVSPPS